MNYIMLFITSKQSILELSNNYKQPHVGVPNQLGDLRIVGANQLAELLFLFNLATILLAERY